MLATYDYVTSDYVADYYVGTLDISTIVPDYGASNDSTYRNNAYEVNFSELRAEDGINTSVRKWNMSFSSYPQDVALLEQTLRNLNGVSSFTWTPPIGASGYWICEEFNITYDGYDKATLSCIFEEVFG